MFARVKDGLIDFFPIENIRNEFPNISFPRIVSQEDLPDGYVIVERIAGPQYNPAIQKLVPRTDPSFEEGRWVLGYDVAEMTQEEIDAYAAAQQQNEQTIDRWQTTSL